MAKELFGKEQAAAYDERFKKVGALKESLHLLIRILFSDLPEGSRILCVGAGTGAEILALAEAFPSFGFMAVEPSLPMLEVCRDRVVAAGMAGRCAFHHGYIETLPEEERFDAATSLLVSQFLTKREARVAFFAEIAKRLRTGAYLVNADLSADLEGERSAGLKECWQKMLVFSDVPEEQAQKYLEGWRRDVAVLPPGQVEEMIVAGGFGKPTLFYQGLFIHGWWSRRGN